MAINRITATAVLSLTVLLGNCAQQVPQDRTPIQATAGSVSPGRNGPYASWDSPSPFQQPPGTFIPEQFVNTRPLSPGQMAQQHHISAPIPMQSFQPMHQAGVMPHMSPGLATEQMPAGLTSNTFMSAQPVETSHPLGELAPAVANVKESVPEEIAEHTQKTDSKMRSDNPFEDLPDGSVNGGKHNKGRGKHVVLPSPVEISQTTKKPKRGFFARIRRWFGRGGSDDDKNNNKSNDVVDLNKNEKRHNHLGRHRAGKGRASFYSPPLQYSSHLVPVSAGVFDLRSYDVRPYRAGHPLITRRRFITRIINRKPARRPQNRSRQQRRRS